MLAPGSLLVTAPRNTQRLTGTGTTAATSTALTGGSQYEITVSNDAHVAMLWSSGGTAAATTDPEVTRGTTRIYRVQGDRTRVSFIASDGSAGTAFEVWVSEVG